MRPLGPHPNSGAFTRTIQSAACELLPLLTRERVKSLKGQLF